MPAARITGPEIAARRTFGPRLLRARPAAPHGWPRPMPGARECLRAVRAGRQPPSEHADVARKGARVLVARDRACASAVAVHATHVTVAEASVVGVSNGAASRRAKFGGRRPTLTALRASARGELSGGGFISTTTTAPLQPPLHAPEKRDSAFITFITFVTFFREAAGPRASPDASGSRSEPRRAVCPDAGSPSCRIDRAPGA